MLARYGPVVAGLRWVPLGSGGGTERQNEDGEPEISFPPPEAAAPPPTATLELKVGNHTIAEDIGRGVHTLVHAYPIARSVDLETGTELYWRELDTFTIRDHDPLSARVLCERTASIARGGWSVRLEATSTMSADETTFHVNHELRAFDGARPAFANAWSFAIPRDGV